MFNAVSGLTSTKLYSSVFGKSGLKKSVNLRTAYKSEPFTYHIGEVEAFMYKTNGVNHVMGTKSLQKPVGASFFEVDKYRKGCSSLWELPEKSKIANGLVALNLEPGYWIFAPSEDMQLNLYKKLLEESPWVKVSPDQRSKDIGVGEGKGNRTSRDGLEPLDQLIINALEQFIVSALTRIGMTKYEEEILHLDSDICRTRLYLQNYVDKQKDPKYEPFIKGGSIVRAKSNESFVLRPKSELFRLAIQGEIERLDKYAKRSYTDKLEGKEKLFMTNAEQLASFLKETFPDAR